METVLQSPVFGNAPKTLINISSLPLPLPGDRKGDSEVDRVADRGTEGGPTYTTTRSSSESLPNFREGWVG